MAQAPLRVRLLTAILSPLLFLAIVEGVLRVAGFQYTPSLEEKTEEARRLPTELYERDPELLWTMARSTVLDEPQAGYPRVRTNSLGLRGGTPPGERRPGEFRVLCLGDSVTFGLGVRDGFTWPEQLQRLLAAGPGLGGRPVHVLNGGVVGWSSVQGMRFLNRVGWYHPDVIVFWFGMNDVCRAWGRPDREKGGEPGALYEVASALSLLRTVQLLTYAVDAVRGAGKDSTRASLEDYASAVERLKALEADGGPRVIFIRYPAQLDTTAAQLAEVLAQAEAAHVEWVSGPLALLIAITPAPAGTEICGRVVTGPNGPELRFRGPADLRYSVDKVRTDLEDVHSWRKELQARRALLPEGAPDAGALFGDAPAGRVFADNCHLTEQGCRLAAEVIAARILACFRR